MNGKMNYQPSLPDQGKTGFKSEGKIKIFSKQQELRKFNTKKTFPTRNVAISSSGSRKITSEILIYVKVKCTGNHKYVGKYF